jgi:hypothetical protein
MKIQNWIPKIKNCRLFTGSPKEDLPPVLLEEHGSIRRDTLPTDGDTTTVKGYWYLRI